MDSRKKLYEICDGRIGCSYSRSYVWADTDHEAETLFKQVNPGKEILTKRVILMCSTPSFATKMDDEGFPAAGCRDAGQDCGSVREVRPSTSRSYPVNESLVLTRSSLRAALQRWEEAARLGAWEPQPDQTPEQVAAENTEYLWRLLSGAE